MFKSRWKFRFEKVQWSDVQLSEKLTTVGIIVESPINIVNKYYMVLSGVKGRDLNRNPTLPRDTSLSGILPSLDGNASMYVTLSAYFYPEDLLIDQAKLSFFLCYKNGTFTCQSLLS